MRALSASQRRVLAIVAAHPDLRPGVRCGRVTDEAAPTIHTSTAWSLCERGLVDLAGIGPFARITDQGAALAAELDQDASCATGA